MRILYIGAFRLPQFDAAAFRVINNGKALLECGHEVSYISWGGQYLKEEERYDGCHRIHGMKYIITGELDGGTSFLDRIKSKMQRGVKTMKILKDLDYHPDIIISYNAGWWFTRQLLKFTRENNIKLVNDITEWYDNNELHLTDRLLNWVNMNRTQRKVKNKILISSYLDIHYTRENNIIVPPLFDSEQLPKIENPGRENDALTFIYAGNPAKKDKLHEAIKAINKLMLEGYDLRFNILGISKEDYLKRFSDMLIDELSLNIVFHGRLAARKIPAFYKQSDLMVLMRDDNRKSNAGFPTKFVESFSLGVPVVANLTSDLGNYLKDEKTGLIVNGNDYIALYDRLKNFLESNWKERIREMKKKTLEVGLKSFDYRNHSAKLQQFIDNLQ